jgi:hypothetical protein
MIQTHRKRYKWCHVWCHVAPHHTRGSSKHKSVWRLSQFNQSSKPAIRQSVACHTRPCSIVLESLATGSPVLMVSFIEFIRPSAHALQVILVCSSPDLRDGRYWRVLRDTVPEYVLFINSSFGSMRESPPDAGTRWVRRIAPLLMKEGKHRRFSSFVVQRHCCVMSSFEPDNNSKSHNHLDVA